MGIRLFRISGWEDCKAKASMKLSGSTFAKKVSGTSCTTGNTKTTDYSYLEPLEPHPEVFKILDAKQGSKFLYLEVLYPHCTNFEGRKVLLMKDTTIADVCLTKVLDPHFYPENKIIARFRPDEEGKNLAMYIAGVL